MHQVYLSHQLYQEAQQRAAEAGFASVDEYVADMLTHDFQLVEQNMDGFFTAERLTLVDQTAADAAAGSTFTPQQAKEALARSRDVWLSHRAGGE